MHVSEVAIHQVAVMIDLMQLLIERFEVTVGTLIDIIIKTVVDFSHFLTVKMIQQTIEMPEFVKQAWEKEIVRNNNTIFSEKEYFHEYKYNRTNVSPSAGKF